MLEVGDRGEGKNARPWMSNRMEAEASEGSVSENMGVDETRRTAVREGSEIGFMLPESGRDLRPESGREIVPGFWARLLDLILGAGIRARFRARNPGANRARIPAT